MKTVKLISSIFLIVGVIVLLLGVNSVWNTISFLNKSEKTTGIVIDYTAKENRDSDGRWSTYYYPVFRFSDKDGNITDIHSSIGSGRPSYTIGENISVLYRRNNPVDAKINSFSSIWLMAIILSVLGVVFTAVGGFIRYSMITKDIINKNKAAKYTATVDAKVTEVMYDNSIVVNGRSPFRIIAQWYDERVNKIYVFKSQKFWYDPSEFLTDTIEVKADPTNYKKYWMDTSFIPEVVE